MKQSNILFWNEELKEDVLENRLIIVDDILQEMIVLICSRENKGIYFWDGIIIWISLFFQLFLNLLKNLI